MLIGLDNRCEAYAKALPGRRVLLAEDDDSLRDLLAASLERVGLSVIAAPDGRAFLAMLSAIARKLLPQPDAMVMDVHMPGHTGVELLRAARAADWTTPAILITAFASLATRDAARELRATILEKPLSVDSLVEAIFVGVGEAARTDD